jgi:hypothetical protein
VSDALRIPSRYRLALLGKASLLLLLMGIFLGLTVGTVLKEDLHLVFKVVLAGFFAVNTAFLAWTSWLGMADAVLGQAVQVTGATPLPSRKSGISFRLAGGGSAEYLLVNSWAKAVQGHTYGLTIGRYSHVIIEEPRDEGATPAPSAQSPTSP